MILWATILVLLGFPAFVVGSFWMFSGKTFFNKREKRNVEGQGICLLLTGFVLLFTGIGMF